MPLTFSIADGVAVGFIAHAVAKVAQRDLQGMRSSLTLAGISIAYFMLITMQA
jgi:adenine/guanine/hypoxanthine permease